jgi:O-antigen ligase
VQTSPTNRPPRRSRPPGRPPDRPTRHAAWCWILAFLPLLAVVLGGATERWSQGIVLALLGAILVAAPPRFSLGWKLNCVVAGLAALALTGFLPARWFAWPAWRAAMVDDFGFILPSTLSPQPWLTAESGLLFLAGMSWLYLMATINWTAGQRARAGRIFGAGVVALAAVFLLLAKLGIVVPIWLTERNFGPFPNRNQTANFLAVGALPVLACAQLAWRAGRRGASAVWLLGWLVIVLAAFASFSRAGVVLLFVGTAIYVIVQAVRGRGRDAAAPDDVRGRLDRWRAAALGVSLVAVLLSTFLFFGGETLDRFRPASPASPVQSMTTEFRLRIQGDALHMIAASPWCGLGLGNFAAVFPIFRVGSAMPARAIHPESDWLWMVAEMGWLSLALVLAGCALLLRGIWPWRRAPDRPMRTAAAVALVAFAIHSFVDVSAHRLGTCLSVLFVLGLALRGETPGTPAFRIPARWPGALFRVLGLALMLGGGTWILEARGVLLLPGKQGVARMRAQAVSAAAAGDYATAETDMNQALAWAPLDWSSFYTRAAARVYLRRDEDDAAADFRRARYLEPFSGDLPRDEARLWLAAGHAALAANALVEACRREPVKTGDYMSGVSSAAPHDAAFERQMGRIVRVEPGLLLAFLEQLEPPESGQFIAACLRADPDLRELSPAQRTLFFRLWALRGDTADLAARMARRPDWQRLGWRWWADACGKQGDYQRGCEIDARFAPPPVLPRMEEVEVVPRADLAQEAAAAPGDAALALRLYAAEKKAGEWPAALAAVRRIAAVPDSPGYFHYLEALAAAQTGDWAGSWNAWQDYLRAINAQD